MGFGDRLKKKRLVSVRRKMKNPNPLDNPADDESERIIYKMDRFQDEYQDNSDDSEGTRNFRYWMS